MERFVEIAQEEFQPAYYSFVTCAVIVVVCQVVSPMLFVSYRTFDKPKQVEWDERILSTIHAILAAALALNELVTSEALSADVIRGTSPGLDLVGKITLGYMAWDLMIILTFRRMLDLGTFVHHSMYILIVPYCLHHGLCHWIAALFLFMEATTPFVNQRWFFYEADMKETKLYLYNGLAMLAGFFFFRVSVIPYVFYLVYLNWTVMMSYGGTFIFFILLGFIGSSTLNVYWFSLMFKGFLKAMKASKIVKQN